MSEDGGVTEGIPALHIPNDQQKSPHTVQEEPYPMSPQRHTTTPNPFSRRNTSIDIDDYFSGPRDISKHSKWPLFMQLHGSILPKMIIPLLAVAAWATLITVISMKVKPLGISSILLTVTGFVVGLGLSFRSSSAYERYAEGRKLWGQLMFTCQGLGRVFWLHVVEREGSGKKDLLGKLTAMNLVVAFAVSLKHKLRFEPYTYYDDLVDLVEHLDTFAKSATDENTVRPRAGLFKAVGSNLGLSFAASNPRKLMKKAQTPLGNLPLEILCYLTAYVDELALNGQLPVPMQQTAAYNNLQSLNDVLVNTERVLNTPLPIAYAIAISQITWIYVFLLPFQLLIELEWITIPATIAASYIILGIFFIGHEIEDPFGNDVNDLPLDLFCQHIVQDMETIAARRKPRSSEWVENPKNKVMFPHSESGYSVWVQRPETAIRNALRNRPHAGFDKADTNGKKGDQNV
ncbi:UPF0187-domain-containing protein [Hypoxylon trugodes]|uniref:UPF0187-domain-containing protein n=1 Tax=Hypoxylon trugodes TaxID=326681 RepID=UPI002195FD49|nr:UPF0187-domain-containing protein [Hypoxylon trugodes]KAI1387112.1 UPF0187-domain-containing protein [Hypoxylon trugodes]